MINLQKKINNQYKITNKLKCNGTIINSKFVMKGKNLKNER